MSGYEIVDEEGKGTYPFEWASKSKPNIAYAIFNRLMSKDTPPDPTQLKKFRAYIKPILHRIAEKFEIQYIDLESFLAEKKWDQNKKNRYRAAVNRQLASTKFSKTKTFDMFLKTGEVYSTTDPSFILHNEKTRSRPIFSPTKDTFGIPCLINNYILK